MLDTLFFFYPNPMKEPCQIYLQNVCKIRFLLTFSCIAATLTQAQTIPLLDYCKSFPCFFPALLLALLFFSLFSTEQPKWSS